MVTQQLSGRAGPPRRLETLLGVTDTALSREAPGEASGHLVGAWPGREIPLQLVGGGGARSTGGLEGSQCWSPLEGSWEGPFGVSPTQMLSWRCGHMGRPEDPTQFLDLSCSTHNLPETPLAWGGRGGRHSP